MKIQAAGNFQKKNLKVANHAQFDSMFLREMFAHVCDFDITCNRKPSSYKYYS